MVGISLAAVLLYVDPDRTVNRRLALLLAVDGFAFSTNLGFALLAETAETAYFWHAVNGPMTLVGAATYLYFLATLRTPVVRGLRRRATAAIVGLVSLAAILTMVLRPSWFVQGVQPAPPMTWLPIYTPAGLPITLYFYAVLILGLIAAISLYRRTQPGSRSRDQARSYVAAFATRDGGTLVGSIMAASAQLPLAFGGEVSTATFQAAGWITMSLTWAIFGLLITFGLLRNQLLDIHLRVKRGIRTGALAVAVLASGLLVSEGVRWVAPDPAASVAGLLAVGVLGLAIGRLGHRATRHPTGAGGEGPMPRPDAQRLEVYQAALEEAIGDDGVVVPEHAPLLQRLREKLPITGTEHQMLLDRLARTSWHGAPEPTPGHLVLGKYAIEEPLGSGGQGTAFLARDTVLDRDVVVKAIPAPGPRGETMLEEARMLARISNPRVITVHDAERVGDQVFIVTEYLEGGSLADRIAEAPLDPESFHAVATHLLEGLAAVHEVGLLHRDVKPSNVLLEADGGVKLADLGLAAGPSLVLEDPSSDPASEDPRGAQDTRTDAGSLIEGTVPYMSPEQARGEPLDIPSDLYSAATTLLEAYTGQPHQVKGSGEAASRFRRRIAQGEPLEDDRVGSKELARWFARALDPDPGRRFPDARAMANALPPVQALDPGADTAPSSTSGGEG